MTVEEKQKELDLIERFEEYVRWCKPEESFRMWKDYAEDCMYDYWVGRTGEPGFTPEPFHETENYDSERPYAYRTGGDFREIATVNDFREELLGNRDEVMEWLQGYHGGLDKYLEEKKQD